jgi:hypothetical protein
MNRTAKMSEYPLADALKALTPNTKAGKVRALMPLIEEKIDQGVRISEILDVLKAGGLVLSEGTFKNYLHRARRRQQASAGAIRHARKSGHHQQPAQEAPEPLPPVPGQQGSPTIAPVSMRELDRIMKPDPAEQANEMARYERLAKQQRRNQKS